VAAGGPAQEVSQPYNQCRLGVARRGVKTGRVPTTDLDGRRSGAVAATYGFAIGGSTWSANSPASAGGWGNPCERDPELVRQDVRNDLLTVEHVAREYGGAIDPATLDIDQEETERLRSDYSSL
jgi:N-methylhydantoinase B